MDGLSTDSDEGVIQFVSSDGSLHRAAPVEQLDEGAFKLGDLLMPFENNGSRSHVADSVANTAPELNETIDSLEKGVAVAFKDCLASGGDRGVIARLTKN